MIRDFAIILAAVALILFPVFLLGGNSEKWVRIFGFFYKEEEAGGLRSGKPKKHPKITDNPARPNPKQAYTEMAILQQKIDERRRVVDSTGHSKLYDEYFELVFETRKHETIRLVASRAAFKEIPFNQMGALTYKKGELIKFKYSGGLVLNETIPVTHP